jgi:hypothetical protein
MGLAMDELGNFYSKSLDLTCQRHSTIAAHSFSISEMLFTKGGNLRISMQHRCSV